MYVTLCTLPLSMSSFIHVTSISAFQPWHVSGYPFLASLGYRYSHPLAIRHSQKEGNRHWLVAFLLTSILPFPYIGFHTLEFSTSLLKTRTKPTETVAVGFHTMLHTEHKVKTRPHHSDCCSITLSERYSLQVHTERIVFPDL